MRLPNLGSLIPLFKIYYCTAYAPLVADIFSTILNNTSPISVFITIVGITTDANKTPNDAPAGSPTIVANNVIKAVPLIKVPKGNIIAI